MAMIKCPECGQEISDKAKKCVHCGKVLIEEKSTTKICSDCGKENPIDAIECIYCGCSFENKKETKNFINRINMHKNIFIGIGLVVICISILLVYLIYNSNSKYYYNGIKWGTDYNTVIKKLEGKIEYIDDKYEEYGIILVDEKEIENYNGFDGVNATVYYEFKDEKMDSIGITLTTDEYETESIMKKYYKEIVYEFTKLYGEPETDIMIGDDLFDMTTKQDCKWNTKKSDIYIALIENQYDEYKIHVYYNKITDKDEEDD